MYKLLLVSDQDEVLDAFAQINNWELLGFKQPHIRHDFEGTKDSLAKHHADGICIAVSKEQEELLELVENAYKDCLRLYKSGVPVKEACEQAEMIFERAGRKMPHTLGHGIGLEIHEFPRVSTKMPADVTFKPGMIITLEPGLYDENAGGVRLENDVLITEDGNEVITHSRIIRL